MCMDFRQTRCAYSKRAAPEPAGGCRWPIFAQRAVCKRRQRAPCAKQQRLGARHAANLFLAPLERQGRHALHHFLPPAPPRTRRFGVSGQVPAFAGRCGLSASRRAGDNRPGSRFTSACANLAPAAPRPEIPAPRKRVASAGACADFLHDAREGGALGTRASDRPSGRAPDQRGAQGTDAPPHIQSRVGTRRSRLAEVKVVVGAHGASARAPPPSNSKATTGWPSPRWPFYVRMTWRCRSRGGRPPSGNLSSWRPWVRQAPRSAARGDWPGFLRVERPSVALTPPPSAAPRQPCTL